MRDNVRPPYTQVSRTVAARSCSECGCDVYTGGGWHDTNPALCVHCAHREIAAALTGVAWQYVQLGKAVMVMLELVGTNTPAAGAVVEFAAFADAITAQLRDIERSL